MFARGDFGERAPAAADLEQALAGPELKPAEQRPDLALLRLLQRIAGREQRARIGHARIEPGTVKVVAEIVMVRDVEPRALAIVAAEQVGEPVDAAPDAFCARDLAETDAVAHEQVEQRHRVRARPFPQRPGLVPADRAGADQPDDRAPAVQVYHRHRPRPAPAQDPVRAIGQGRVDAAFHQPRVDPVEDGVEPAARQAREQAAAGRETAIGRNQVTAARLLLQAAARLSPTGRPRPEPGAAADP
jgi:hypothetical protein